MAWNGKMSATQLTSIVNVEQFFDQTPGLVLGQVADVQLKGGFNEDQTDALIVSFYGTLDDSAYTWDSVPFQQIVLTEDTPVGSFLVLSWYRFRVGVMRSGSVAAVPSCDMSFRTSIQL